MVVSIKVMVVKVIRELIARFFLALQLKCMLVLTSSLQEMTDAKLGKEQDSFK